MSHKRVPEGSPLQSDASARNTCLQTASVAEANDCPAKYDLEIAVPTAARALYDNGPAADAKSKTTQLASNLHSVSSSG